MTTESTGLAGKMMVLERRRDFLLSKIQGNDGSAGSLRYAQNEVDALDAALDALRLQRAAVSGLDTPLAVLRELMESLDAVSGKPSPAVLRRASEVLEEYEA
jgi:hypothetical protein